MIISRIIEEKNPKKGNVSRSRMKTSNTNNTQYQSSQHTVSVKKIGTPCFFKIFLVLTFK